MYFTDITSPRPRRRRLHILRHHKRHFSSRINKSGQKPSRIQYTCIQGQSRAACQSPGDRCREGECQHLSALMSRQNDSSSLRLLLLQGFIPHQLIANEVQWFYTHLGINDTYFLGMSPSRSYLTILSTSLAPKCWHIPSLIHPNLSSSSKRWKWRHFHSHQSSLFDLHQARSSMWSRVIIAYHILIFILSFLLFLALTSSNSTKQPRIIVTASRPIVHQAPFRPAQSSIFVVTSSLSATFPKIRLHIRLH